MSLDLHARLWATPAALGPELASALPRLRAGQPWRDLSATPEGLFEQLRPGQRALVRGLESRLIGADIGVEAVAAVVAGGHGRLLGAAGLDPTVGQAARRIEEAAAAGMRAIAMSPAGAGFIPSQWHAIKAFEACEHLGLPVLAEGVDGLLGLAPSAHFEMARPHLWDPVLRRFPRLRVVVSGMGDPWIEEAMVLLSRHPNAFTDLGGLANKPSLLRRALTSAVERGVLHKVMFASAYPLCSPAEATATLMQFVTDGVLTGAQARALFERDLLA